MLDISESMINCDQIAEMQQKLDHDINFNKINKL
jgi:hypothetical protein